jgi:hypothetical protein
MSDVRESFPAFCAQVLRQPLWPHQIEAAAADAFITVIPAARRTGKTELAENLSLWTMFRERDVKVLITSATEDAARRSIESMNEKLARSSLTRGAVVDDYKSRIKLTNGSECISTSASGRQVRGYGKGVRLVILDEAGFMPGELWTAAHYTALDERPHSRILMVGTPWGPADHFFRRAFEAGQEGDPDHAAFNWTYEVNPKLDRAYIERQRERVSPAEFAAETMGTWSDATGSLFPRALLDRQTVPFALPRLDELEPPARGSAGIDWGVSFDQSAVVAIYRLAGMDALNAEREWRPRFVALPYVWKAGTPLHEVVEEVAAQQDAFAYLSPEANGVGAMPLQELKRKLRGRGKWNPVHTTNALKTAAYGAVLAMLEREQLFLPRDPSLLRQLSGLKFEQGERGFTRIEAESAVQHDDVADALALSMLPYRPSRGGVACRLMSLASPSVPLPDADLGNFEGETYTTAGGIRAFKRPPLQGVQGSGVTFPASSTQSNEPRRLAGFRIEGKR